MNQQQSNEGLFHVRPDDWDDKYGPYGTPPDYTPPMTATNNIQSPVGLRIGGVVFGLFFLGSIVLGYSLMSSGEAIAGELIFMFIVMLGLSSYMTWWCFHLAKRREKWLSDNKAKLEKQQEREEGQS